MPTPPIDEHCLPVLIEFDYGQHAAEFIEYLRGLNLGTLESVIAGVGIPAELIGDPAPNHIVGGTDGN